jgi:hypothetical protein
MARVSLSSIPGIGDVTAELLFQHGFKSAQEVADAGETALAEVEGIEVARIPAILESARERAEELKRLAEEAEAEAAAAAAAAAAALEAPVPDLGEIDEPLAVLPEAEPVAPLVSEGSDSAPVQSAAPSDRNPGDSEGGAS